MTAVSDVDEATLDLDWFAIDKDHALGHFTTGGLGFLPRGAASSREVLEMLTAFFCGRPRIIGSAVVNPNVCAWARLKKGQEDRYLEDFVAMAERGLFSYDHVPTGRGASHYFRVAAPTTPLALDQVPDEIRQALQAMVLPKVAFALDEEIPVSALDEDCAHKT